MNIVRLPAAVSGRPAGPKMEPQFGRQTYLGAAHSEVTQVR